jgi:hypothetical protein
MDWPRTILASRASPLISLRDIEVRSQKSGARIPHARPSSRRKFLPLLDRADAQDCPAYFLTGMIVCTSIKHMGE